MSLMDRLEHYFVGHAFGGWVGRRSRDICDRFYGYRERRCSCGAVQRQQTDNIYEFDRWIDEAVGASP